MTESLDGRILLDNTIGNLEKIAGRIRIRPDLLMRMREPMERIELSFTPVLSEGESRTFKAFIVHHSRDLGPAKGGIRMAKTASLDETTGLAMEMTWKTALIGVPFGGGKSGIIAAPDTLSKSDKEIVIRAFSRAAMRHIGPELYVPAPDMGTNETDMGHIRDCFSYSWGASITRGCYVTGKPVLLGGIPGRREATGKGVALTTRCAADVLHIPLKGARVVLQGFGNVGSVVGRELYDMGAKVIAVSDIHGATHCPTGLDMPKLAQFIDEGGSMPEFPHGASLDPNEIFLLDCDMLVPAATANQIHEQNADNIKARIIAEAANGPTSPAADTILNEKGVFVIPDILCNAGGVFVSYLEYTQETQREQMTIEMVQSRLKHRMESRFQDVYNYAQSKKVTMRDAALELAIRTVADAIEARGLLP